VYVWIKGERHELVGDGDIWLDMNQAEMSELIATLAYLLAHQAKHFSGGAVKFDLVWALIARKMVKESHGP
jgi:hypothetical protein